ncbi:MAG: pimelyl-ACP methyl ester esterase BioV [Sulfurovum sp.]|nr:pimelyl-ACP methyl ester esterase BioV [Sulfurovum sp.]
MRYFNGFSLKGEEKFFDAWLIQSDFCVAGFSFGAQQALEHVLQSDRRVERLILLSPAFFQTQKPSFVRAQLRYFDAGRDAYISQFLQNVAYPSNIDLSPFLKEGSKEALEALLTYEWDAQKLQTIQARGTVIEVVLGGQDRIIDAKAAFDFFGPIATTYYIKDAGHLLRT